MRLKMRSNSPLVKTGIGIIAGRVRVRLQFEASSSGKEHGDTTFYANHFGQSYYQ